MLSRILPPGEQARFFEEYPEAEIIPTRWVDADKSEPGQEPEYKSRLVARGDLEKNNSLRTDSPTTSHAFLELGDVILYYQWQPSERRRHIRCISAGIKDQAQVVLKLPADGIPGQELEEGSLMVCNKSVYGTKDAPRGFWKQLHDDILECGLQEFLLSKQLTTCQVTSARLWAWLEATWMICCGVATSIWMRPWRNYSRSTTSGPQQVMSSSSVAGSWCRMRRASTITCPAVLDRVKRIYMTPDRRKQRSEPATESEVSQLRSVVGSLSWYSRVCRPDLAHGVNQLQSVQQKARVDDLMTANRLLNYALETKDRGIHFPSDAFDFRRCMILSINDASHAASFDVDKNGRPIGHRSQSGRDSCPCL